MLLNDAEDRYPSFLAPSAAGASYVLCMGADARFVFDPTGPRLRLAAYGGSCHGCLLIGPTGVRLRVPVRRSNQRFGSRDVDVATGHFSVEDTAMGDVAVPDWELRLPPTDQGAEGRLLHRFSAPA